MENNEISSTQVDQLIQDFANQLSQYSPEEKLQIIDAAQWARELHRDQKRASGEPYIIHPLNVARILMEFQPDVTAVIAALLHDILEDTEVSSQEIIDRFDKDVEHLVNGVTKISIFDVKNKSEQERETIRKMILAMDKDIRVVLIKLADKRHNMNTLQYMRPDKQKRIAQECLEIYAPLAGKLGIYSIKTELEDLSLKFLKPEVYQEIKFFLNHQREERQAFLLEIQKEITLESKNEHIDIEVKTRAKHFYSIYHKMKTKGKELNEIYDFLGLRILCETTTECYTLLGLVHQIYKPLAGRFKDYIAMPKENGYRSLHTTVMTPSGHPLEVQIRTKAMDQTAELGVAAHWAYKEGKKADENNLTTNLLKKLRDLNATELNVGDYMEALKKDVLSDTIFVFTPQGDTIELPRGATAIDFAYHIHTDLGDHSLSAKADGAIIPLNRPLRNTQTVSIQTSNNAHPHLNWLRFVKTNRAKSKIKNWLNKHDNSIVIDKQVVAHKRPHPSPQESSQPNEPEKPIQNRVIDNSKVGVSIDNERNVLIHFAKCCEPTPGDRIIGFISTGRGIIVHKTDCPNLGGIANFKERKIEVVWENFSNKATQSFKVNARYVPDLFSKIEGAIRKYQGHLISGSINETENEGLEGFFTVEMNKKEDFKKIAKSIRTIPAVLNIQKIKDF